MDLAALLGAYELTVHARDIDRTTGRGDELPSVLVDRLLTLFGRRRDRSSPAV